MGGDIHYETITAIRREAGLLKQTEAAVGDGSYRETIDGALNGSNRVFSLPHIPIVDQNNDDVIDTSDVLAFVDGHAVEVESIIPNKGTVTLVEAPAVNSVLIIRYSWSPVADEFIKDMREGVEKWINSLVAGVFDLSIITLGSGVFPNEWRNITRLRTAGYLQIQDWGENVDTDGTSKDGYKKLEQARNDLQDWIDSIGNGGKEPGIKTTKSIHKSDAPVFLKGFDGDPPPNSDRCFHNRRI